MFLPPVRVKGDVRHHINGGLEDKEGPVSAQVVKAVLGDAALHIDPEGLAETVGAALVSMTRNTLFICANENRIVIFGVFI